MAKKPLHELTPLHDWILVRKDFQCGTKTKGGIMVVGPGTNKWIGHEERPMTGTVLSIGGEVDAVEPGDRIHFPYAAGTTIEYKNEKLAIIRQVDLNGVLTDE